MLSIMITNGEKFACESCIRGHRVAQCQHTDRPLQRVGKKGRPVSQCNHCRSLRTARSVHTKCKCGSTSRQATLKNFGQERCLCCEGGDCTCAYKAGPKHCGSSTSSPSATSQRTPGMVSSPALSDSTAGMTMARDIADTDGTYSAPAPVALDSLPPEGLSDTWTGMPDSSLSDLAAPQTPDWLGSLDSVLGTVTDGQPQFTMPAFDDPLLAMDPSSMADLLSDLPQGEQLGDPGPVGSFDGYNPLDYPLTNFDGHEQWFSQP